MTNTRTKMSVAEAHCFALGEHASWVLSDGFYLADIPALVPPGAVAEATREMEKSLVEGGKLRLAVNVLLLQWGKELILVDTGCANCYGPNLGNVPAALASVGFSTDDITSVLFTHLHLDHLAGAVDLEKRVPRFPRARHYVARDELAFWSQTTPDLSLLRAPAEVLASVVQGIHQHLAILEDRLTVFNSADRLFEGIQAMPLPGHTPGHVGFEITAGDDRLWFLADALTQDSLHVRHPEWTAGGDTLPELNVKTRRALLHAASREQIPVLATHFTYPGCGYVKLAEGGRYRFESRG